MTPAALSVDEAKRAVARLELEGVKALALTLSLENYRLKKVFRQIEQILRNDPARGGVKALAVIRDAVPRCNLKLEEGK